VSALNVQLVRVTEEEELYIPPPPLAVFPLKEQLVSVVEA
jgi:hypothetical protein